MPLAVPSLALPGCRHPSTCLPLLHPLTALQLLDQPAAALTAVRRARQLLSSRVAALNKQCRQEAAPDEAPEEHAAALQRAAAEAAQLSEVVEDMTLKEEELEAAEAAHASMKQELMAAMAAAMGGVGGVGGGAGGGGGGSVRDLGVVGGGRRVAAVPVATGAGPCAGGAAAGAGSGGKPQKRSLDSLMGGAEGATLGFGASNTSNLPQAAQGAGSGGAAPDAKRPRADPTSIAGEVENQQS